MTVAFICDNFFRKKVSPALVNGEIPGHKIITIAADEILQSGKLPEGINAILAEKGTWQKNFSMFRYFGLLPEFEKYNIAFVANTAEVELKGRSGMKNKEFVILSSVNEEDAIAQLNRLAELPAPAFTHTKSRAIA